MILFEALQTAPAETERSVVRQFTPWTNAGENQPLLFVKPEVTQLGDSARPALEVVEAVLAAWGCEIDGISLLGPAYLQRHKLIEAHYGQINTYSTRGLAAISAEGREAVTEWLSSLGYAELRVLGAHEYLEETPGLSSGELLALQKHATQSLKIAGGAYAAVIEYGDSRTAVINGFHPAQLEHFYTASAPILVATLRTTSNWRDLRRSMIGATDPTNAEMGSMRQRLFTDAVGLGLESVDGMRNCVHLSAGPLEAAIEISRYFGNFEDSGAIDPIETNIGALVVGALGRQFLTDALSNKDLLVDGRAEPAFDLTEELNTDEAFRLLTSTYHT